MNGIKKYWSARVKRKIILNKNSKFYNNKIQNKLLLPTKSNSYNKIIYFISTHANIKILNGQNNVCRDILIERKKLKVNHHIT